MDVLVDEARGKCKRYADDHDKVWHWCCQYVERHPNIPSYIVTHTSPQIYSSKPPSAAAKRGNFQDTASNK